jgi:hypothetical protein
MTWKAAFSWHSRQVDVTWLPLSYGPGIKSLWSVRTGVGFTCAQGSAAAALSPEETNKTSGTRMIAPVRSKPKTQTYLKLFTIFPFRNID